MTDPTVTDPTVTNPTVTDPTVTNPTGPDPIFGKPFDWETTTRPRGIRVSGFAIAVALALSFAFTVKGLLGDAFGAPQLPIKDPIHIVHGDFAAVLRSNGLYVTDLEGAALRQLQQEWDFRADLKTYYSMAGLGTPDLIRLLDWAVVPLDDSSRARSQVYLNVYQTLRSRLGMIRERPLEEVVTVMLSDRGVRPPSPDELGALRTIGERTKSEPPLLDEITTEGLLNLQRLFNWSEQHQPNDPLASLARAYESSRKQRKNM